MPAIRTFCWKTNISYTGIVILLWLMLAVEAKISTLKVTQNLELKDKELLVEEIDEPTNFLNQQTELISQEPDLIKQDLEVNEIRSENLAQYFSGQRKLPCLTTEGPGTNLSISTEHKKVTTFKEKDFGLLELTRKQIQNSEMKISRIFSSCLEETSGYWYYTDWMVRNVVLDIIEDMLVTANLHSKLRIRFELGIASLNSDILSISCNECPVGAVEILKPIRYSSTESTFNSTKVQGKLLDYMLSIRSFHGLRYVFSIITDCDNWRICWLPDSDDAALATDLSYSTGDNKNIDVSSISSKCSTGRSTKSRVLHGSQIYSSQSETSLPLLATALVSVLCKMNHTKHSVDLRMLRLLSAQRTYVFLNKKSWFCTSFNSKKLQYIHRKQCFSLVPPSSAGNFILLRDYHGGADGKVWLAASVPYGNLAVIKFHHRMKETGPAEEMETIKDEVKVWKACGITTVFSCTLNSRPVIVMPFAFHCKLDATGRPVFITTPDSSSGAVVASTTSTDTGTHTGSGTDSGIEFLQECQTALLDLDPCNVLQQCADRMAKALYVHEDIEWRHVAVTPLFTRSHSWASRWAWGFDGFACTFIDYGRVSTAPDQTTAAARMQPRIEQLIREVSVLTGTV